MCEASPPMLHSFAPWLPSVSQHFLVVAIALLVYVLTTRARREQRAPTSAIAWVLGMLLLVFGENYWGREEFRALGRVLIFGSVVTVGALLFRQRQP